MTQGIQNNFRQKSLLWFSRSGLTLLVGVLLLPVGARYALTLPDDTIAQATQQREATEQEATRAAAERAFQEGMQLFQQRTAESLRQAITKFEEALPLYRAVGDSHSEAVSLGYIGYIYDALGDKEKALEFFNQSLPLSRATGDKATEAVTLNNIGRVYDALGEKQTALEYYNQSLPLSRATGDKAGEAVTLNNIGGVYDALGDKQTALEYYNQSLPLRRATGDKAGEARTLNNIGLVYSDLGDKQKALEYYNQSLPLTRETGDKAGEARTLNNIAWVQRDQGNLNEALTQIEAAINIIEDLRTKIASQELRTSYFAQVQNQGYYQFYIDLLMQLHQQNPTKGYDAIALHASERSRARSLLELLTEANANIRQGIAPELLEQERSIQQQLNAKTHLKYQLLNGDKGYTQQQIDEIEQKIESLLDQLETIKAELRVKSPGYAALKYPQPLTLEEIQSTVLDDNTLLLQYSLGSERSFLWAVTKTGITSYELPPSAEIEAAARKFRELLQSETTDAVSSEAAQTLSQMLLAPVAAQLGEQRLLVVGDGILQTIPFAALPLPEPDADTTSSLPLLVQNEIVTLPSASTIAISRRDLNNRPLAPKTLAVLADPVFTCCDDSRFNPTGGAVLPEEDSQMHEDVKRSLINLDNRTLDRLSKSRQEAAAILALVPENQRLQALDFTASRTTATSPNLAEYQIVHLATHGLLNTVNPELSGIVLSLFDESGEAENGFLRLHDIYNLNLPAELVVLSACQTGLGEDVKGEGLVGLTRGFMYAGARRVTVSLWNVKDSATARLMETYYQKMLNEGLNPVEALRAAQLEMRKTEQWSNPYYWAAFVVQGEWQ